MKVALGVVWALMSVSTFAKEVVPVKVHQCVLETAGVLEKASTLYSDEGWSFIAKDLIASDSTRIAAVTRLKNDCLKIGNDEYTLRISGTDVQPIHWTNEYEIQAHNLLICKTLIKDFMTCEIGERAE